MGSLPQEDTILGVVGSANNTRQDSNGRSSSVLNSWKEIAAYVGRGVRTVQRWERELGFPVRRPRKHLRSPVTAITTELDEWMRGGSPRAAATQSCICSELSQQTNSLLEELEQTCELAQQLSKTITRTSNHARRRKPSSKPELSQQTKGLFEELEHMRELARELFETITPTHTPPAKPRDGRDRRTSSLPESGRKLA